MALLLPYVVGQTTKTYLTFHPTNNSLHNTAFESIKYIPEFYFGDHFIPLHLLVTLVSLLVSFQKSPFPKSQAFISTQKHSESIKDWAM